MADVELYKTPHIAKWVNQYLKAMVALEGNVLANLVKTRLFAAINIYIRYDDGLRFWFDLRDLRRYTDLFSRLPYEDYVRNDTQSFEEELNLNKQDLVIDVGAHIGRFCLPLWRDKGTEIIAVEPEKRNVKLLIINIKANRAEGKIKVIGKAMMGKRGWYSFREGKESTQGWVEREGNGDKIQSVTLADTMGKRKVALLKLDCEGGEYEIVNMTPLSYLKRINAIWMEVHPGDKKNRLLNRLEQAGFTVRRIKTVQGLEDWYCRRRSQ